MHPLRLRAARWREVVAVLAGVLLGLGAGGARAQIELTVTPSMVKGPAQASVTIVEFSDYQ